MSSGPNRGLFKEEEPLRFPPQVADDSRFMSWVAMLIRIVGDLEARVTSENKHLRPARGSEKWMRKERCVQMRMETLLSLERFSLTHSVLERPPENYIFGNVGSVGGMKSTTCMISPKVIEQRHPDLHISTRK